MRCALDLNKEGLRRIRTGLLLALLLRQGAVLLLGALQLPLRPPFLLVGRRRHGQLSELLHGRLGLPHILEVL